MKKTLSLWIVEARILVGIDDHPHPSGMNRGDLALQALNQDEKNATTHPSDRPCGCPLVGDCGDDHGSVLVH